MLFTEAQIASAYDWLCKQRRHYPAHADVWHLRFHWEQEKIQLLEDLQSGHYQFSPLQKIQKANGEIIHLWCAKDSLVLKLLTYSLAEVLPVSRQCTHIKGHGGLKETVGKVYASLPQYNFVVRTDVKGYYASIDHHLLINKLAEHIHDRNMLNMLWQTMCRMVEWGGLYKEIQKGIARGCPLSPLLGAFFLTELDNTFDVKGLFYVRYMDDILILTPTRWKLRRAVKTLNDSLSQLRLVKHPDKTFIGKIDREFDFLGYHFSFNELTVAEVTWKKFLARLYRLYEQKKASPECDVLLGLYVRRWRRWVMAGLGRYVVNINTSWIYKSPHAGGDHRSDVNYRLCFFLTSGYTQQSNQTGTK
jgi:hypothetical protein